MKKLFQKIYELEKNSNNIVIIGLTRRTVHIDGIHDYKCTYIECDKKNKLLDKRGYATFKYCGFLKDFEDEMEEIIQTATTNPCKEFVNNGQNGLFIF